MSERDGFYPGVPCWVDTGQPDPDAARKFYGSLFGWTFIGPGDMPGDPPGRYFVAQLRGRDVAGVSSLPVGAPTTPVWSTYIQVASADDSTGKAKSEGGKIITEPFDVPPAGRMAVLADRQGAVFCVWEPRQRKGAQLVNEAGAWAMSALTTEDPDDASTFYKALFGWRTEAFGSGADAVLLYRLDGYVGGEPQQPVPRDVVAAMVNSIEGQGARWDVNFWVNDADETAARAEELGGRIVTSPFDTSISRDAVISDAQGAVISVSEVPGRKARRNTSRPDR
jgi:predicted enzyme related to lactoylglutathione lyase